MEKMYFLNLKEEEVYLNLVMNYSPETIYTLQRKLSKKKEVLSPQQSNLYKNSKIIFVSTI
jgi:hypothetical protein